MAKVNTFLCNCGRNLGRPKDEPHQNNAWGVVPWHAEVGQAKLHGIKCGTCRQNWTFAPSIGGPWAEVFQCCSEHRCSCRYDWEEEE